MPLNLANISGSEGHPGIPEEVDDDVEQVVAPGLLLWRQAVASSVSSAQLMLCVLQLNGAISWEKSIMKVVRGQTSDIIIMNSIWIFIYLFVCLFFFSFFCF